jgi:hypothetical protein
MRESVGWFASWAKEKETVVSLQLQQFRSPQASNQVEAF